ncbi:hypothetical protein KP79_PYT14064 [Mizuhopecten yessoensis]|uniref:Protein sleepless n=2 Tax=Mizuhopecten yessoensis TaxID=6573 RepID=A0A210QMZ6_MIZYE|nr:hypothetical protein KP79_PYT14064 [Mizuhopecten yessoensis]
MDIGIINDHTQSCNSSSCDKRINEEFHTLVIRQCGQDGNFDEDYYSAKCKEMTNFKVCKCRGDVCNGQSNIVSSLSVLTSAVLAVLVLLRQI